MTEARLTWASSGEVDEADKEKSSKEVVVQCLQCSEWEGALDYAVIQN